MEHSEVSQAGKEQESANHKRWALGIDQSTILLYTDGSKNEKGVTSSA